METYEYIKKQVLKEEIPTSGFRDKLMKIIDGLRLLLSPKLPKDTGEEMKEKAATIVSSRDF